MTEKNKEKKKINVYEVAGKAGKVVKKYGTLAATIVIPTVITMINNKRKKS